MPLEITMRAGDFVYVGTSRITVNSAGGTVVSIDGNMPVVRRRDYVDLGENPTAARQFYVMLQTSYLANDFRPEEYARHVETLLKEAPEAQSTVAKVNSFLASGDLYKALKAASALF